MLKNIGIAALVASGAILSPLPAGEGAAQSGTIMYQYIYFENGSEVGFAEDVCLYGGGTMTIQQYGYATNDYQQLTMAVCRTDGTWIYI